MIDAREALKSMSPKETGRKRQKDREGDIRSGRDSPGDEEFLKRGGERKKQREYKGGGGDVDDDEDEDGEDSEDGQSVTCQDERQQMLGVLQRLQERGLLLDIKTEEQKGAGKRQREESLVACQDPAEYSLQRKKTFFHKARGNQIRVVRSVRAPRLLSHARSHTSSSPSLFSGDIPPAADTDTCMYAAGQTDVFTRWQIRHLRLCAPVLAEVLMMSATDTCDIQRSRDDAGGGREELLAGEGERALLFSLLPC